MKIGKEALEKRNFMKANKFITKCSISLVISEMQSKTTIIISTLTGMTETKSKKG